MKSSKSGSSNQSRVKSGKSSHVRSASMCDPDYSSDLNLGVSLIKKTQGLGTSALKKSLLINKYKKMDLKKNTESMMLPDGDI